MKIEQLWEFHFFKCVDENNHFFFQNKQIQFLNYAMPKTIKVLVINEVFKYSFYPLRVLYEIMHGAVKVGALVAVGLEHPT